MADRLEVTFTGGSNGSGGLTWGQQHMWQAITMSRLSMNMCAVRTLDSGTSADEFVDELRYYIERFESMRTLLRLRPDGSVSRQVVIDSGATSIRIVDVPDGDAAAVATSVAQEQEATHFDYEHELPIRMVLIRQAGAYTHLIMTLCHLAADAAGGIAMYMDFVRRSADPIRMTPLGLAAAQRTPAARKQSDASLAYWARHLRAIPMRRFLDQPPHDGPYFWEIRATSPLVALAVRAISRRVQADTGTVLMALWAIAVARLTRTNPAVVQVLVSNRFRPGLADIVSTVFQAGLIVIDVSDASFDEVVARTRRAVNSAAKHAYYDFGEWEDLVTEISKERGGEIQVGCFFNDRPAQDPPIERDITRADIDTAERGVPVHVELANFHEGLMLNATELDDGYDLAVRTHTQFVSRDEAASLIGTMEDLAAAAVFSDDL